MGGTFLKTKHISNMERIRYNTKSTYTVYIVELCFSRSQQAFFYSYMNRDFTKITGK